LLDFPYRLRIRLTARLAAFAQPIEQRRDGDFRVASMPIVIRANHPKAFRRSSIWIPFHRAFDHFVLASTAVGEPNGYSLPLTIGPTPEGSGIPWEMAMTVRSVKKFGGLTTAALFAGMWMLTTAAGTFPGKGSSGDRQITAPEIEYGDALICHTRQDAEQLVAHFDGYETVALNAVNAGERGSDECGLATVAFVRGQELATVRSEDATFQITQILVVGVGSPTEFKYVVPAAFISLFKVKEYDV
jgi:hypothetical protein